MKRKSGIGPGIVTLDSGPVNSPDRAVSVADLTGTGEQRIAISMKPESIVMEIFAHRNGNCA